jgi:hypothetical protein
MRQPDLTIGPADNPQTLRWHIFRSRGWQLSLHKWLRSDDDRALHDHSGHNISIILNHGYYEVLSHAWEPYNCKFRFILWPYFRRAGVPHRIQLSGYVPVWSLWLRWPPIREWGFHCPKGWRHWKEYCDTRDYSASGSTSWVGPGCD